MLGPFDEDDDDFCKPVSGTNLANVFSANGSSEISNESLMYVPPKQQAKPSEVELQHDTAKIETNTGNPKAQSTTCIIAKIVTAYQISNNETSLKGKLGLALIKLSAVPDLYKIVLYTGSKKTIATATTSNKNVHITLQANNYINMYDDLQQNWSMLFASQKDYNNFVTEAEKCNIKLDNPTIQLTKESLQDDTVNNLENITEGINSEKTEEEQEESEEKIKADLLKRMAKMGQAILPKPCSTNEQTSDSSDSNDKNKLQTSHKKSSKPSPAARKHVTIKAKDPPANLNVEPPPVSRPRSASAIGYNYHSGMVPSSFSNSALNADQNVVNIRGINYLYLNGELIPVPLPEQTFPSLSQQNLVNLYTSGDPLSLLFAENRTHNAELRMNVNRMSDKLEKLFDKIDKIDTDTKASSTDFEIDIDELKMTKLLPKITEVTKMSKLVKMRNDEAEKLKMENFELKLRIKSQEETLAIRDRERRFKEIEFNKLKAQIELSESKLSQLEDFCDKIVNLKTENEELFGTVQMLEQQLANIDKNNMDNASVMEEKNKELEKLNTKLSELSTLKDDLDLELENTKASCKEQIDTKVKNIMSEIHRTLIECFTKGSSYDGEDISRVISRTIKDTTIRILEQN